MKETYEKYEAALRERNELGEYTEFDLGEYFHAIKRTEEYLSGENDSMEELDARIYWSYIRNEHSSFVQIAKEVDEQEFFYSQETGGTIVSSALYLMDEIVKERYPENQWNIYAAQASDGDNWADDSPKCRALLEKTLLPLSRHYAYIEITSRAHQSLWHEYEQLSEIFPNFSIRHVKNAEEILPTFRDLFKKATV